MKRELSIVVAAFVVILTSAALVVAQETTGSIAGGSGLENQYVVDGVNISNAGFGALGSYSIVFGSLGNGVIYDFIKEVQVKSGGYEAEYGQSTGGVVNVITKSGSNRYRGSLFGFSRPDGLESKFTEVQTTNGTVNVTHTQVSDFGVTLGGPALKDRLFFFGAVDPQYERRRLIAPEGFPLRSPGEVTQDREIFSYAAKGTWQVSNNHRIDASLRTSALPRLPRSPRARPMPWSSSSPTRARTRP